MAKYRTYKNGIFGHRYKGYYIIRGESKGLFKILDEAGHVIFDSMLDFDDCTWQIDKMTAPADQIKMMKELYFKDLFFLNSLFIELMMKKEQGNLDEKSEILYCWVDKIRDRKIKERNY